MCCARAGIQKASARGEHQHTFSAEAAVAAAADLSASENQRGRCLFQYLTPSRIRVHDGHAHSEKVDFSMQKHLHWRKMSLPNAVPPVSV